MGQYSDTVIDTSENSLSDKITAIKTIATDFERRITGFSQKDKGATWIYVGNPLVSKQTASKLSGLMQSFANEINLISEKDNLNLAWQKYETIHCAIANCLMDIGCPAENYSIVIKMFKNTLKNISDVIGTSKKMFEKMFNSADEEGKPEIKSY